MENIINYLNIPNVNFALILYFILTIFKVDISCRILIDFFNCKSNIKNRILYFVLISIFTFVFIFLLKIPILYVSMINVILSTLLLKFIFKINILPAITSIIAPAAIIISSKLILIKIIRPELGYFDTINIPINYIIIALITYSLLYLIFYIIKKSKITLKSLNELTKQNKILFSINMILYLLVMFLQIYLMMYYKQATPLYLIMLNLLILNSYFFISFYLVLTRQSLKTSKENLKSEQLYARSLKQISDNLSFFKHDFYNIVQAIGGYIEFKDYDGLEKYYKKLLEEVNETKTLAVLSPVLINNPALQSIISNKYFKALDKKIEFDIEVLISLDNLDISAYDLSRIMGILLDNAIEAASLCDMDNRQIFIKMYQEKNNNKKIIEIQNTYTNKNVDLDKIYEKGYTSKTDKKNCLSHGLGLAKVRRIIASYQNLNLYTTKNNDYFIQQFEIYNI